MRKLTKSDTVRNKLAIESSSLNEAALIYRAMYHPLRLKIIEVIHKAGKINVTKLNRKVRLDKSLLSQQLKILRDASILKTERDGKQVSYAVNYTQVEKVVKSSAKIAPIPNSKPIKVSPKELASIRERVKKPDKPFFTSTELRIITFICDQYTSEEIGEKLTLSKRTVEDYRLRMIKKINAKNTVGLVLYAVKNQLYKL